MSDTNYQMLVEIGGIMDGVVPRAGICTTADGVRWLCDRVQELKNEIYETRRERDETHSILEQVTDRLEQATIELIKLQSQRDEARAQLRIAVGLLSTQPQFADKHPEDLLAFVKEGAK